ncbi:MAG: hypothetical protein ACYDEJ_16565 [Desulfitobacteriaceae bacterium]
MITSVIILTVTLVIFTIGKSPIFRVDRAGIAIIGATLTIVTGLTFDQAVFSTLAGNLTLTGSIANLIVVELAKKQKVNISFSTYFKIGFPLTITLVAIGLIYFKLLFGI